MCLLPGALGPGLEGPDSQAPWGPELFLGKSLITHPSQSLPRATGKGRLLHRSSLSSLSRSKSPTHTARRCPPPSGTDSPSLGPCLRGRAGLSHPSTWDRRPTRGRGEARLDFSAFPLPSSCTRPRPPPAHQAQLATLMVGDQRRVLQVDDAAQVWTQPGRGDSQGAIRQELWARRKRERHAAGPGRAGRYSSGGPPLTTLPPCEVHVVQG